MLKAIALIEQHSELTEISKKLKDLQEHTNQRLEFLKKQATDCEKQFNADYEAIVKQAEGFCRAAKLIPEGFDGKEAHLHVNVDAGVVTVCDGKHNVPPLLRMFDSMLR